MTNRNSRQDEQLEALLALALDQESCDQPCPGHEALVAWHEKSLSSKEKKDITRHISRCSHCYQTWSELAAPLMEMGEREEAEGKERQGKTLPFFFKKLGAWFRPANPWMFSGGFGGAAAVALVVLLVIPNWRIGALDKGIDESFQLLPSGLHGTFFPPLPGSSPYVSKSLKLFPVTAINWESQTPSFQAFGVGIKLGLEKVGGLSGEEEVFFQQLPTHVSAAPAGVSGRAWQYRKRSLAAAGQWIVLLRQACNQKGSISSIFWEQQQQNLERLASSITSYPEADTFVKFFEGWQNGDNSPDSYCKKADELIDLCF